MSGLGEIPGGPEVGCGDPVGSALELVLVSTGMVSIPPINGGAVEAYVADLARIFSTRSDVHVSVISNHRAPVTHGWEAGTRWVPTHSPVDSFPLRPAPSAVAHVVGGSISAAVAYRHIDRLARSARILVHLNEEISAMAFARLGRRIGRVFTIHNPPPSTGDGAFGGLEYVLRQASARATWRFALRQMDAVIALTPWIQQFLVEEWRLSADRIHVLPLPVDVDAFRPGPAADLPELGAPWRLLFVGRLEPRKNVLTAVEALQYLPKDSRLTVVGDGPLASMTMERARALGIEGRVEVLQRIPLQGLVDLYRNSTVLVLPSHLEAYPRVVVEAAACGLPAVVPNHPMFDSFLKGGCADGFEAIQGAEGLAEAVRGVASDPGRLAESRRKAREYALQNNSYPIFGERLAQIYDRVVP
jgi:glycosyltransferase involved in cell wall biosynthesis